jgi:hypothetical protein
VKEVKAMMRTAITILSMLCFSAIPGSAWAQAVSGDSAAQAGKQLPALIQASESPSMKQYLTGLQQRLSKGNDAALSTELANAVKVANQINARKGTYPLINVPLTYYTVPAISPVKRLPSVFPQDGRLCGGVQIVAAKDEFEPASFVIFAFDNIEKAELKASALSGSAGTITADNIDLKVVKCWYQAGTAWYSYFADSTGREMVPELLLNDENLIKVDTQTRDNYLRVDYPQGAQYVWISNPAAVNIPFNTETAPVADAKTLQPFQLAAGEFKQFWITVKVPKNARPGIYTGSITIACGGTKAAAVPLAVRVLPFQLPRPMTNYDLSREYYTMLYNSPHYRNILQANGGNTAHADRKMRALYQNMRDHNIMNPLFPDYRPEFRDSFIRELRIMKSAGISTDPLFGGVPGFPSYNWLFSPDVKDKPMADQPMPQDFVQKVDEAYKIVTKELGHHRVYCFGWDEPSMGILVTQRKPWKYIADKDMQICSTGNDRHLLYAGYNEDFCNTAGTPTRERADKWHAMGNRIMSYANPHTGPENPDFMRRVHGLHLYKANHDGIGNYILSCTEWNDFLGSYNYRCFNMTYPTRDGVIDTLEWEGTREAVDDVRYATKLKQLAKKAIATGKTEAVYAGRRALQWLELLDEKSADLNAARLEMINYILQLDAIK